MLWDQKEQKVRSFKIRMPPWRRPGRCHLVIQGSLLYCSDTMSVSWRKGCFSECDHCLSREAFSTGLSWFLLPLWATCPITLFKKRRQIQTSELPRVPKDLSIDGLPNDHLWRFFRNKFLSPTARVYDSVDCIKGERIHIFQEFFLNYLNVQKELQAIVSKSVCQGFYFSFGEWTHWFGILKFVSISVELHALVMQTSPLS